MTCIELARDEDLSFLASLWEKNLQACWTLDMIQESWKNAGIYTRIAWQDMGKEKIFLGFLMGSFLEDAELYALVVRAEFRKKGIGSLLLRDFLDVLQEKNKTSLFLEVSEDNLGALSFYKKLGFEKIGTRPNYYEHKSLEEKSLCRSAYILEKKI